MQNNYDIITLGITIGKQLYLIGLEATDEEYAAIAEEVCLDYTDALCKIAVKDEPNPAKLKWNC